MNLRDELRLRADDYAMQHQLMIVEELGFGVHGSVFIAENHAKPDIPVQQSAVKAHQHEEYYIRERDIYLRLQRRKITQFRACEVPRLLNCDDLLLIIEMSIVTRPFVLDFAGAYLDKLPNSPKK